MRLLKAWIAALWLLVSAAASSQGIIYDSATAILSITAVSVGSDMYVGVTLLNVGPGYRFSLKTATPQSPPGAALAICDPASGVLTLPFVAVGATYYDVTMQYTGDYAFVLKTVSVAVTGVGRLEAVARLNRISAIDAAAAAQAAGGSSPGGRAGL